ncbi:MAG: molybdopterin biosynthesis protein [Eggerthellaceae bacterium]|nr:molybdopterin biosynthesis protein [Eggerthellaceae bacterium]
MAKALPSMDEWLKEAKLDPSASECGMYLIHNGVVRSTPRRKVREGDEGAGIVDAVDFSYDEKLLAEAEKEALSLPGIYYVRTWLNEGMCNVGDSLMFVLVGGDIRPHVIDALQSLVGTIKTTLVDETEILVD